MAAPEVELPGGLTGLDWVVIVAATVSLVVIIVWLVQGREVPPGQAPASE